MHVAPLAPAPLIWGLTWRAPLPPYQQAGIARLLAAPGVLLADEMGLGKTIQAIGALRVLLRDGAPGPALIVVPAGLVLQWRQQLREWAPELTVSTCIGPPEERRRRWRAPAQVYLTGFDALRGDMALPAPYGPRRRSWQVVVADEAQRIKNAHTAIAATVKALPRHRAWALTGTPLENRPDDAVSILDFATAPAFGRSDLLAAARHLIETWHGQAGGRLSAAVSVSAPQRVSPDYFADLDALSRKHDLPFYAHMLETKLQRVLKDEQPRFAGRSLVRYTSDLGFLSERMNVIHAIWVDEADLDLIAAAGATVAHNPISNLRLGSGVMPFRPMRDRGIPICFGTDEAIADDAVNMWGVVKMAGLIHNIADPDPERWPTATEVLDCLIAGGARAMRRAGSLGAVEEGRLADLILVDVDTLAFTPINDLHRQLVYCETGSSVRLTMVAGRTVFDGDRITTVDEADILAEARELFGARQPALAEARRQADRWLPAYRAMVAAAAARDVGINRWVGAPFSAGGNR